ncbi:endonuclease [Zhengella mangrovi]|uniref:Endonuclease n=2 Tax=Zhengella mangrovi TaxID=1982044 RepID=A0A2G1QUF1_9HYPH|nr:endonuclease [Zhengella mangrovi]
MAFTCVTYNIQYGTGMDGRYDLERIAGEVRGADVIALQEVCRNNPQNGGHDMVAGLAALLPEYFHVYGAPYQVDMGSAIIDGKAVSRYFEFGNMILSRGPILASRNFLLPRSRSIDVLNLQRGALEAIIGTPAGPVRFHSVHLDHTSAAERSAQIRWLLRAALEHRLDGGAATGLASLGYPELPAPEDFVLMGDFNMDPESPEYVILTGPLDPEYGRRTNARFVRDVSVTADGADSWFDPAGHLQPRRLDFCFASAGIAHRFRDARVDSEATGSDHRPVWVTMT